MINQVVLVGRLTNDIKIAKKDDTTIIYGSLAQNFGAKGSESTYYFNFYKVVKSDSKLVDYLKKGTQIAIVGTLVDKKIANPENKAKSIHSVSINVSNIELLDRIEEKAEGNPSVKENASEDLPF